MYTCACLCAHAHILLVPTITTRAKEPGEGVSRGLTTRFARSEGYPVPRWKVNGWAQEAGSHQSTTQTINCSSDRKGGERKSSLCPTALWMFVGSFCSRQDDGGGKQRVQIGKNICFSDTIGALDIVTISTKSANLVLFLCTVTGFYLLVNFPGLSAPWELDLCSFYLCLPNF